ncbi:helix-turn-helix domain-containing protein [Pseudomonas aeruginosa]|uniref:helix-turn-helix domain-containing protein n=1 Tax=Pseudomonas aeruginosa TaxID=287 RepID=UPI003F4ACCDB
MDKLAKALGERIRMQRKTCRISQDALALACSLDRSYVGRIERGEVNITVEKLYRIAGELACEPSSLLPKCSAARNLARICAINDAP